MNLISAVASMCIGAIFLSIFTMVVAINLAYVARRWYYGIRDMA